MISEADLLAKLTAAQLHAVTHVDGPLLVLAGPGSGKTRVITHRVAYLIHQGICPQNILAITFTNKAAQEMRQRLAGLEIPGGSTICTFHSLAARLLREFAERAHLPRNFSIYDDADQKAAMRDALKALELDMQNYPPARMLDRISRLKNDLVTAEAFGQLAVDFTLQITARVYAAYENQLAANGALDFDDLLMRLALLLRDDPELRNFLNERYQYVLVDEYQDTNHCQYQIARGLALNHGNICVTGDPDQSIYGWRGADIRNILVFEEDYPNARVVRLEENFRSTPEVLRLANELIRANVQRKEKDLFTAKAAGAKPQAYEYYDERDEAAGMASWIGGLRRGGLEYRDMAVFYRINSMSRVLEESLRREHIPYQIVRGVEFYHRAEIKDVLAYLRVLVNPADQVALARIINQPTRGIGQTTIQRLISQAEATGTTLWQTMNRVESATAVNTAAQGKVRKFVELIMLLQGHLEGPVAETVRLVYEQSGLQQMHAAEKTEEQKANVEELINSAADYDQRTENPSLADYLQQIALVSDADAYDEEAGAVALMTLHAAKGLEFPAVLIVGVEEGLIPHTRSRDNAAELEEERRLLFVGITRAKEKLALSFARNRTVQGASLATIRSQFLRRLSGLEIHAPEARLEPTLPREEAEDRGWERGDEFYDDDEEILGFRRGQLVRHPQFGLGRIQQIMPSRENTRVVVQFNTGARKTLVLPYAKLEKLDFPGQ